jgi:hypothetical protein
MSESGRGGVLRGRQRRELPSPQDGLSGTERRVLRAIAAGATTPADAFRAEQDLEDAPFLGDAWFYRTLSILGHGEPCPARSAYHPVSFERWFVKVARTSWRYGRRIL